MNRFSLQALRFILPRAILSLLVTALLAAAGALWIPTLKSGLQSALYILNGVFLVLLALSIPASSILSSRFKKRFAGDAKAQEALYHKTRDGIQADYQRAKRSLSRLRVVVTLYILATVLMSLFVTFVSGALEASVPLQLLSFYLLFGILVRISFGSGLPKKGEYADRETYSALYRLAEQARDAVGVSGKIYLFFDHENGVSVYRHKRAILLRFGYPTLGILREEELYAILLHEATHLLYVDRATKRDNGLMAFLDADEEGYGEGFFRVFSALYDYVALLYAFRYSGFRTFSAIFYEELADLGIKRHGKEQDGANALAKVTAYDLFESELSFHMEKPFYAHEAPIKSLTELQIHRFFEVLPARETFFRSLFQKEIKAKSASHPILRERLAALGVSDYGFPLPEESGDFRSACQAAIAEIDKTMYEDYSKGYEEARRTSYLEPLATVEQWEAAGKGYTEESLRKIISALLELYRFDDLLSLCDRVIAETEGGLSCFAYFHRGRMRLLQYDTRGFDDLYAAMENPNYIQESMPMIGRYACLLGLEDELLKYRSKTAEYLQHLMDFSNDNELSSRDRLVPETVLPEEIQARNLAFFRETCGAHLVQLYLVRKILSPDYATSIYVLRFSPDTDGETVDRIGQRVFEYLDNSPEEANYSFFYYSPDTAAAVAKVDGSCIYDKTNT